jgi:hypothetical protein
MCRVRNTHTTPPWTTAYVCITIDDSCLDENGRFVDKPMTVRMVQWQPYCVTKPFDAKTPVCAACKRTNRTRSFCRDRHKHRQLPWCSVYVLLSTLDTADPSTIVAGSSQKLPEEALNGETQADVVASDPEKVTEEDTIDPRSSDTISSDPNDIGDDIADIAESRTFLAKVSCRSTSIHWLEMAEYDVSETVPFAGSSPVEVGYPMVMSSMPPHAHMLDPNQPPHMASYYQPNINYAAQQHQNELKSRQQYFFQMQQHQYPPHGSPGMAPPGHWQQPMPYGMIGPPGQQGEQNLSGVTAGEAAAAAKQRATGQPPPPQQQQQQHWAAMYYPHGMMFPNPPLDSNGQPSVNPGGSIEADNRDEFQTPPESTIDDSDDKEPDEKRPRIDHDTEV